MVVHTRPLYTGHPVPQPFGLARHHPHAAQGFCSGCGHPRVSCCCGCRECRKEAKELLVEANTSTTKIVEDPNFATAIAGMSTLHAFAAAEAGGEQAGPSALEWFTPASVSRGPIGLQSAFIGGGCCVHLSVEYTPAGAADGAVAVVVIDSHDTALAWMRKAPAALGYQVKEGIITTKPGARLVVLATAATARVRWCEVFSCC